MDTHQKILVVDDEKLILKFLRANLETRGFEVITAEDGETGLRLVGEVSPDLVILDIMMPKMNGIEACQRIREQSDVPIIMLSARGTSEDKIDLLNLGADDYITKPFILKELLARVDAILRRN
ncbi:MAG: response regulator transcription factor [Chloroflexi bacterium]|jgi:two-component system, OmpR family, response regulator VicR|nr:response regulator transcription factor [Chloroflexota bacterium]